VADHFAYLATLGILVPAAVALSRVAQKRLLAILLAPALALMLGAMTWQQSAIYRDEETLYRATLGHNPDAWPA
jgi:hypothetical protein